MEWRHNVCCKFPLADTRPYAMSWNEFNNTARYGGVANSAASIEACQETCALNPSCDGLDWNIVNPVSQQCYLHGPWSGYGPDIGNHPGAIHYTIIRTLTCSGRPFFFLITHPPID